jgi:uncharacterized protein (DUF927 family)
LQQGYYAEKSVASHPQTEPAPWPPYDAPLLEWAEAWLAHSFSPIPLKPATKRPFVDDWPAIPFEKNLPLYFGNSNGNRNLGVALGRNGLTDIDLDCPEATVVWREYFGPPTNLIYGRDAKPGSHWFYYMDPPLITAQYQTRTIDPATSEKKARTILELRCLNKKNNVGLQSMVPNSIHPETRERIRFEPGYDECPAHVAADRLKLAASKCAAAVLLAWNFPAPGGGRHNAFLALAGVLLRALWSVDDAVQFHCALYRLLWPHDPDFAAAQTEVQTTAEQIASGLPATGFPALAELIDAQFLQKAFDWMGVSTRQNDQAQYPHEDAEDRANHMPYGFRILDRPQPGIYFLNPDSDSNQPPVFVASPLEVVSVAADQDGDNWSRLVRWKDAEGREQTELISMASLDEPAQYRKLLRERGLLIATDRNGQELFSRFLQFSTPPKLVRLANYIGWQDRTYVFPRTSISPPGAQDLLFRGTNSNEHYYRTAGTFDDWQRQVSIPCSGNSRLIFSMSCAFAAPLMRPLSVEGGGFHLRGDSSLGKTTAQIVAGSAVGGGKNNRKGFVESWRTTVNGLEAIAWCHADNLLPLDEMIQVEPREADQAIYMLANGSGKIRMTSRINVRPSLLWLLLVLSSGEVPLSEHVATAGKRLRAGAEVRLLNFTADAGMGLGLFEDIHGAASPRQFADDLVEAANTHYGHAQRRFLQCVVNDYLRLVGDAHQIMQNFFTTTLDEYAPHASAEVGRGLKRIAAVVAGGELATTLGITGWERREAAWAGEQMFVAWLQERGGKGPADLTAALRQTRQFLATQNARFSEKGTIGPSDEKTPNRAGFWWREGDHQHYLVFSDVFRREVALGYDHALLAAALQFRKHLVDGEERGHPYQFQVWIPGVGKVRGYHLVSTILEDDSF